MDVSAAEGVSRWQPPAAGWVKLNADGATATDESWAATGGLLRDASGGWLVGFQRFIGRGTALNSEFCAILHGLELARLRGFEKSGCRE